MPAIVAPAGQGAELGAQGTILTMAVGMNTLEDELYREIILDHWRSPRHYGEVAEADTRVHGDNPLCGDEVLLTLRFDADRVEDIAFTGHGCSISRASASMMCEQVSGDEVENAEELIGRFRAMLLEGGDAGELDLGDLEALQGVARMPARVKCAVLPWNALREALHHRADGLGEVATVTTELGGTL
jgi:nitrogen fixation NifU-like protein